MQGRRRRHFGVRSSGWVAIEPFENPRIATRKRVLLETGDLQDLS